jgi:hypothetical protein
MRVHHDDVAGVADFNTVILQIENASGTGGDHFKTFLQVVWLVHLQDICVEVRNPDQGTVAIRRRGVEYVVGRQRAIYAVMNQAVCVGHAAGYRVIVVAAHQEEVGRGEYRHCYPDIGKPLCDLRHLGGRHQRKLGHMTDCDTASEAVFFGQVGDQVDVKILSGRSDIEVHVDIDVEFSCKRENAADLAMRVAVVSGSRSEYFRSTSQPLDQELVRSGNVGKANLREDAQINVYRPAVIAGKLLDRIEAAHSNDGIDLHVCTDTGRAMQQALAKRAFGASIDIRSRNAAFEAGTVAHRINLTVSRGRNDVEKAAFIKMDVRLDEAAANEVFSRIVGWSIGRNMGIDRNDGAGLEADIDKLTRRALWKLSSSDNLIHVGPL